MLTTAPACRTFAGSCAIGALLLTQVVAPVWASPANSSPLPDPATVSAAAAHLAASAKPAADAIAEQIAGLENAGRAQPAAAAQALGALLRLLPAGTQAQVQALAVRGMLQAARHDADAVKTTLDALDDLAPRAPLAVSAAALVRAAQAQDVGPLRNADRLAAEAQAVMPAHAPPALRWQLLKLHARIKQDRAEFDGALRLQHQALALADRIGTAWRRSETRSSLAYTLLLAGQVEPGAAANQEALAIARSADDDLALARALTIEAFFRAQAGDTAGELQAMQGSIAHARRAGSREVAVLGLANLADYYLKRADFDTALKLGHEALPLARELGDRSAEMVALANIGLSLIAKRRPEQGLRYTREAMALDARVGALDSMARFEGEIGSTLERAGYLREAVAAYQRQRKLADEVSRRDQQQAILELQEGQDHERRQRELDLLQRENALQQARLLNQTLTQRLWAAAALAALLLVAVAGLLLHRLRRHNLALKQGNALLRTISEHDALTGLANRHHLQRVQQAAPGGATAPFEGSLLLIDIDHFKRINDRHGHAAGDSVLVEVARRLRSVLRDGDLIVRWGGEEFLVVAHALSQARLEALAQRLLCAVADTPVALAGAAPAANPADTPATGGAVSVTASIGYASFPTQPTGLAVSWDRALALVDTALYLAKAHGRNLAYGVWQLHARNEVELIEISHGLETAWRAGRVQLTASRGPGPADGPGPPPPAVPPPSPPTGTSLPLPSPPQSAPPAGDRSQFAASQ